MLSYNQLHDLYKDVTLNIVSIPAGAGGSFLGYLQMYYRNNKKQRDRSNFPQNNFWDSTGGVPDTVQYSNKEIFNDRPVRELNINSRFRPAHSGDRERRLEWVNYLHQEIVRYRGPNLDNTVFIHAHVFPNEYEFETIFKTCNCWFRVEADYDTLLYCGKLKFNKPPGEWLDGNMDNLVEKVDTVYRQQQQQQLTYPALNEINYNKFFFDIDRDEIEKYFTFIERNEYNQKRFNKKIGAIEEMIGIYTEINKEMLQ